MLCQNVMAPHPVARQAGMYRLRMFFGEFSAGNSHRHVLSYLEIVGTHPMAFEQTSHAWREFFRSFFARGGPHQVEFILRPNLLFAPVPVRRSNASKWAAPLAASGAM